MNHNEKTGKNNRKYNASSDKQSAPNSFDTNYLNKNKSTMNDANNFFINNESENSNIPENENNNADKQLKILKITEKMRAQKYSNTTMASILSTAENLTWRILKEAKESEILNFLNVEYSNLEGYIENKYIFEYYDPYKSGKTKTISSLINQFMFEIDNFSEDYNDFVDQYIIYCFPLNMEKIKVLEILNIGLQV